MNFEGLKKWFSGKALERLTKEAIPMLQASFEAGEWAPGASRRVRAILNKPTVAQKFARGREGDLRSIKHKNDDRAGFDIYMAMYYGSLERVTELNNLLLTGGFTIASKFITDKDSIFIADFIRDFAPIADLIARLDDTRPAPVFTDIGVSPTITRTLTDMGLNLVKGSIRVCPIEWYKVEEIIDGKRALVTYGRLVWPENTVFDASRHAYGNGQYRQCHACGHGIPSGTMVPMLADNADGVPHSLMVGRDCAQSLFGVKMKGDLRLVGATK